MGKIVVFDYNTDGYRFNAQDYRNINNMPGNKGPAVQFAYEPSDRTDCNRHVKKSIYSLNRKYLMIGVSVIISSIIACIIIMNSYMHMTSKTSNHDYMNTDNIQTSNMINNNYSGRTLADNNIKGIVTGYGDIYYSSIVINKGDTLTGIAKKYKAPHETVNEYINNIIRLNNMKNDTIYSGTKIIYYYYRWRIIELSKKIYNKYIKKTFAIHSKVFFMYLLFTHINNNSQYLN